MTKRNVVFLWLPDTLRALPPSIEGLSGHGFRVEVSTELGDAAQKARTSRISVIGAVDPSDTTVLRAVARLRPITDAAIIVLAGRLDAGSIAVTLDNGADDVVSVRCEPTELAARIRAVLRRRRESSVQAPSVGGMQFDRIRAELRKGDICVSLTRREAALLDHLLQHLGAPVTRMALQDSIWKLHDGGTRDSNVIDVYVSYLRKKLGQVGGALVIRSVRGTGYLLELTSKSESASTCLDDRAPAPQLIDRDD